MQKCDNVIFELPLNAMPTQEGLDSHHQVPQDCLLTFSQSIYFAPVPKMREC